MTRAVAIVRGAPGLPRAGLVAAVVLFAACASTTWDREVTTWGSMRAVMRDGRTEGRVAIKDAVRDRDCVGIGALAGLTGEIAVIDGEVWTSRVHAGKTVETNERALEGDMATLLAIARVPHWSYTAIEAPLALVGFEALLEQRIAAHGLARAATIPFVVEGEFAELDAHVLDGACPYASDMPKDREPARSRAARARGTLVGFYTTLPPGTLTHHGSRVHAHVIVRGQTPFVGHVDAVQVLAGARLRLPD